MSARDKIEAARAAYASAGKSLARAVAVAIATERNVLTILDLWGGGESARAFRAALPGSAVLSAEIDPELQPALLVDSQTNGYGAFLGDAADAPGTYDLIWLDLCAQASAATERVVRQVSKKVNRDGLLLLTILPARERDRELVGDGRLRRLPMWIEEASGAAVTLLMPYRRHNGLSMWLVGLQRGRPSQFDSAASFKSVTEAVSRDGMWTASPDLVPAPARELVRLAAVSNDREPEFDRLGPDRKVVRMNELHPAARELVLALIDAHQKSVEQEVAGLGDRP